MHFSWKSMVSHDGRLTTRKKIMGNADGEIRGGGGGGTRNGEIERHISNRII